MLRPGQALYVRRLLIGVEALVLGHATSLRVTLDQNHTQERATTAPVIASVLACLSSVHYTSPACDSKIPVAAACHRVHARDPSLRASPARTARAGGCSVQDDTCGESASMFLGSPGGAARHGTTQDDRGKVAA